jgi:hypothetical protein
MFTAHELTAAYLHVQRQPKRPDDRALRLVSALLDGVLHVVLLWMLFWLLYVQFIQGALQAASEETVQVHWITRDVGETDAAVEMDVITQSATDTQTPTPRFVSEAHVSMPQSLPAEAVDADVALAVPLQVLAAPQPEMQLRAQPLRVTELPAPMPDHFQLPPPTVQPKTPVLRDVQLREQQVQQAVESIGMQVAPVPVKTLQAPSQEVPLKVQAAAQPVQALEMFVPSQAPAVQLPEPLVRTPELSTAQAQVEVQALPLRQEPRMEPSTPAATTAVQAQTPAPAKAQAAAQTPTQARSAAHPAARSTQWPDASQRDDWGLERRDTAGAMGQEKRAASQTGDALYHRDGSVRLPDEWLDQNKIDLDSAGSWLERPGLEYRGTRFDRYWIPQGTLLQEWVRRGIKQLSIPIPGTSLKLMCVVSLLQVGGGCMPVNPNVNDQPATGRPPPDIPFKPELQEDNGSVKPH